jgi:electron transport complex protein RnfC
VKATAHTFAGGCEVPESKPHRAAAPLRLPLPARLRLPLLLRDETLLPLVRRGAQVLRGSVVAAARDGTPLHAPTSGRVVDTEFDGAPWLLLDADGDDRAVENARFLPDPAQPGAFLAALPRAGIVGMGGGGFPLARKLALARAASVHTLVVNAVECEPGMTADETLLRLAPERIAIAIDAIRSLLAATAVVAIDPRKEGAARALAALRPDLEFVTTTTRQPAGAERALVAALCGAPLGHAERPLARGLVFVNVATLHALGEWLECGVPVTERLVTVAGPALAAQGTAWARIGCTARDALAPFAPSLAADVELWDGGPLTGRPIGPANGIAKTTIGLWAASRRDGAEHPCIRCGACSEHCPELLAPETLFAHARAARWAAVEAASLDACIECGVCDVVCPSGIPLLLVFRDAKAVVAKRRRADAAAAAARQRYEAHAARARAAADQAELRRRSRLETRLGRSAQ